MKEIWKDIIGFEGLYMVSNLGNIKSLKKNKILKLYKDKIGYQFIKLSKNNSSKNFRIHRLVAFSFVINIGNKPDVNHIDGNKLNNIYTMVY